MALTLTKPRVYSDKLRDNLKKPPRRIQLKFYLVYDIESIFSISSPKKEVKIKSHTKMAIRYRWYVFDSKYYLDSAYDSVRIYVWSYWTNAHDKWNNFRLGHF